MNDGLTDFMRKVYGWMFAGLLLTAAVAYFVASTPAAVDFLSANQLVFFGLMIVQLGLVFGLSFAINKISAHTATFLFLLYSAVSGVTFSVILLAYTSGSIATAFLTTALTFGAMSLLGYITKKDLSGMGSYLMMGLFGLIIASVVNLFLNNSAVDSMLAYFGVLIFVGLTVYDTQRIKRLYAAGVDGESRDKMAVIGALKLYLDFINLFLELLRILGRRRN